MCFSQRYELDILKLPYFYTRIIPSVPDIFFILRSFKLLQASFPREHIEKGRRGSKKEKERKQSIPMHSLQPPPLGLECFFCTFCDGKEISLSYARSYVCMWEEGAISLSPHVSVQFWCFLQLSSSKSTRVACFERGRKPGRRYIAFFDLALEVIQLTSAMFCLQWQSQNDVYPVKKRGNRLQLLMGV